METSNRYSIAKRVQLLSERFNITQNVVHKVIKTYLGYCKNELAQGRQIEYFGLVTLIPDVITDTFISTLAYDCVILAEELKLPQYTVYTIINEYLLSMREDVLNGREAEIRGIVILRPILDENSREIINVHANTSTTLKSYIESKNTSVTSVRAHTHRFLKNDIKKLRG